MIFSFTDTDPEDITGLDYHGSSNRGTKSVILLTYNDDDQALPEDAISLEILISEVTWHFSYYVCWWVEFNCWLVERFFKIIKYFQDEKEIPKFSNVSWTKTIQ